jgi:hypothetical protein
MELYANLTSEEKDKLLKFPAYITLLAANADGKLDDREKQKANEFVNIKNYDDKEPLLVKFYAEVQTHFEQNLEYLDAQLPTDKQLREDALKQQIAELEVILGKLGSEYIKAMHRSMQSFMDYVSKAHDSVLEHFFFPFSIKGFTEQ